MRQESTISSIVAPLEREPDREKSSPAGAMTIVFTDIEGSTAMVEELGDERWIEVLRVHNRIVRDRLRDFDGNEVKHQGDGFMLAFPSTRAALRFAVELQRSFDEQAHTDPDRSVVVRIGLHTGFVIRELNDFIGRDVIVAARIADAARGGEVLVSREARDFAATEPGIAFGPEHTLELRGLREPQAVCAVDWRAGA
jgi:eukaryotic-like serine/threonine-protein kinase